MAHAVEKQIVKLEKMINKITKNRAAKIKDEFGSCVGPIK